jgi:hypothetical protein
VRRFTRRLQHLFCYGTVVPLIISGVRMAKKLLETKLAAIRSDRQGSQNHRSSPQGVAMSGKVETGFPSDIAPNQNAQSMMPFRSKRITL